MNIKQLETFYWAARLGSFTAAAERLSSTQSTVSTRVQELEQSFGVTLFDRSHRTARLTAKGKELMIFAEQLIDLMTEMQERVSAPESMSGQIRMGVAEVISVTWLPRFVKALHGRYPKFVVEFDVGLTMDLLDKLRNGALDLVLAPLDLPGAGFVVRSLGSVQFEWMASPDLGVPSGPLESRDLRNWPIITLSKESHHHAKIEEWFKGQKALFRRFDTCNSMSVIAALTTAGLGISLIPPLCYPSEIEAGKLQIIATEPKMQPVEFFAMRLPEHYQPITERIIDLAVEISDFERTAP